MPPRLPMQPSRHEASKDGNSLFAKLPPEIRCEIWRLLLVRPSGPVVPVHIPRDTAAETFFSVEMSPNITLVLDAIMQTCRLFHQDQEDYLVFYKFNVFQFPRTRDCLTYVAAITPSRRKAIRNITIAADPYDPSVVRSNIPGDRLRAVATLCPSLRVLRHEKFFYRTDNLRNLAGKLSEFLGPIVSILPLLQEIHIRGANGRHMQMECHMTLQNVTFSWQTSTVQYPYNWSNQPTRFSERGENMLTQVWEMMCKKRESYSLPLSSRRLKDAVASTPILTLGEHRRCQRRSAIAVPQNAALFFQAVSVAPDFIFNGVDTVRSIRVLPDLDSPYLRIRGAWYTWDAVFHSNRMSEAHSKAYLWSVVHLFKRKYISWVYFSRTSKGRRHGNRSPQSKLINCIWRLEWQDRAAKLDVLKELYRHWNKWPRRRH